MWHEIPNSLYCPSDQKLINKRPASVGEVTLQPEGEPTRDCQVPLMLISLLRCNSGFRFPRCASLTQSLDWDRKLPLASAGSRTTSNLSVKLRSSKRSFGRSAVCVSPSWSLAPFIVDIRPRSCLSWPILAIQYVSYLRITVVVDRRYCSPLSSNLVLSHRRNHHRSRPNLFITRCSLIPSTAQFGHFLALLTISSLVQSGHEPALATLSSLVQIDHLPALVRLSSFVQITHLLALATLPSFFQFGHSHTRSRYVRFGHYSPRYQESSSSELVHTVRLHWSTSSRLTRLPE